MTETQFTKGKNTIAAGWPADKIIENSDTKLIIQCENGSYLVYRFIKPTGIPEIDEYVANKVLFQYTDDLIWQDEEPANEKIAKAIQELTLRIQIGSVLI